jgi:hypothetical protein
MTLAVTAVSPRRHHRGGVHRSRWLAAVVLAGTVAVAAGCAADGSSLDGKPAGAVAIGLAVPPLDLDDVAPNIAEHYRTAEANQDAYSQVPCYCGCERSIGHRHLTDCFVRSDGAGWDAHAAGCAVCTDESAMVRRLMADGTDTATIRPSIIAEFGDLAPDPTT